MHGRSVLFSLALVLAVMAIVVSRIHHEPRRKEVFNRNPGRLVITEEALCYMNCLQVSRAEVEEIMQRGIIHFSRSRLQQRPCAMIFVQGETQKGKKLSVLFAQCLEETRVIRCSRLNQKDSCLCP